MESMHEMLDIVQKLGYRVSTLHVEGAPDSPARDVCFHVMEEDVDKLVKGIEEKGYKVRIRNR